MNQNVPLLSLPIAGRTRGDICTTQSACDLRHLHPAPPSCPISERALGEKGAFPPSRALPREVAKEVDGLSLAASKSGETDGGGKFFQFAKSAPRPSFFLVGFCIFLAFVFSWILILVVFLCVLFCLLKEKRYQETTPTLHSINQFSPPNGDKGLRHHVASPR